MAVRQELAGAEQDFATWEEELLETQSFGDQLIPFGAQEMITLDVEQAAGMLACIYGLGSSVDDDDSGNQVSKQDDPDIHAHPNFSYENNIGELS